MRYLYILICLLNAFVYCHVNNKRLLWVEPLSDITLDIQPRSIDFFQKRAISQNPNHQSNSVAYDDHLRLSLQVFNQTIYLHLEPNLDLFHPDAVIHQDGQSIKLNPFEYRVFKGYVIDEFFTRHWWISGLDKDMKNQPGVLGWARIVIRNDIKHESTLFEGAFSIHNDIYHVKLKDEYHLTKRSDDPYSTHPSPMVIYRDSDTINVDHQAQGDCAFKPHSSLSKPESFLQPFIESHSIVKRAPVGCPTSQKVLYMGVAADCTYVKYYQSPDIARTKIITNWNTISNVYNDNFNVAIGLINITLMDATCPSNPTDWNRQCSMDYSISSRLSDFSIWRGRIGNDGAGLWHLMTNCATGPEVGIAWLSQVCNTGSKMNTLAGGYSSGTGVSSIIRDEWKVVAHEIGHNFGAIHDCTASTCPCIGDNCDCCPLSSTQCDAGGRYFMNPTSNASSSEFSPCSISTICNSMSSFTSCLQEPGSKQITTLQMCGNGIVESGEDCDPGGKDTACCDPLTCKFKSGAVCDDANDLCCEDCKVKPANTVCRVSSGECDLEEVCDGLSGRCPTDTFKPDLTSCTGGQCASGQCTSRDNQCRARGVTEKIQRACGQDNSCNVVCAYSTLSCIAYPGYFLDGTPCGIGGVCKSGKCDASNFGSNVKNWIDSHLQIFIPVVIVVGLLFLCCLYQCCFRSRSSKVIYPPPVQTYRPPPSQSYRPPPSQPYPPPPSQSYPPPPSQSYPSQSYTPPPSQSYTPPQSYPSQSYTPPAYTPQGWVDPTAYNGPYSQPPIVPPSTPLVSQRRQNEGVI